MTNTDGKGAMCIVAPASTKFLSTRSKPGNWARIRCLPARSKFREQIAAWLCIGVERLGACVVGAGAHQDAVRMRMTTRLNGHRPVSGAAFI